MMKIYAYVEKGMGKTECQDRVLVGDTILAGGFLTMEYTGEQNLLVAIADGVGGYPGGEKASLLAVDSIRVLNRRTNLVEEDIRALMERTNMQIKKTGQMNPGYESMATTMTALVMNKEKAVVIHIGNCRLYSGKNFMAPLTKDQTVVAEMVDRGEMTKEEALESPIRNQINACLGGNAEGLFNKLRVETRDNIPEQDDNLLLTCDGIHDYLNMDELEDMLGKGTDAKTVCEGIAGLAREKGSADDISIIIVDRLGKYQ
ncbi:MAG: serine/threonine-protein phosphatase [Butyrivibrio sp.]|nr:serine/threonine-protein phosphatase [Butyrivibrio sp.]